MTVVDTNILVYVTDQASRLLGRATTALRDLGRRDTIFVIRQTLRQYLAVMTRPQPTRQPFALREALDALDRLTRYVDILEDAAELWDVLRSLSSTHAFGSKQVHDANIVATMLTCGETRLLTFNTKDFRRFEPLIEIITP